MIPYVKANGCGNDFLIIDAVYKPSDVAGFARSICDRTSGIGADGVEFISAELGDADVSAQLINADGTPAEISGNGTRCVAAYWISQHSGRQVRVRTGAGVKQCRLVWHRGQQFEFEMRMGKPEIGVISTIKGSPGLNVSLGNPHFVVFVKNFDFDWAGEAFRIQSDPIFSQGVNIEFVRFTGPNRLEARFFERGAGKTKSSGTGSCASAVAAIHLGKAKSPVEVVAEGGTQIVRWEEDIFLQGPAELEDSGQYEVRS